MAAGTKSGTGSGNNAHSHDDLEMLREIISSNRGLFTRVLEKIRILRAMSKENVFDEVQKGMDKKKPGDRGQKP